MASVVPGRNAVRALPGTDLPGTDLPGTDLPGTDLLGTEPQAIDRQGTAHPVSGDPAEIAVTEVLVAIVGAIGARVDVRP